MEVLDDREKAIRLMSVDDVGSALTRAKAAASPAAFALATMSTRLRTRQNRSITSTDLSRGLTIVGLFFLALVAVIVLVSVWPSVFGSSPKGPPKWLIIPIFGLPLGVIVGGFLWLEASAAKARFDDVRWLLRFGVCAACGVTLTRDADDDGCITCSCGAAWRGERITVSPHCPRTTLGEVVDHRNEWCAVIDPREMLAVAEAEAVTAVLPGDRRRQTVVGALLAATGIAILAYVVHRTFLITAPTPLWWLSGIVAVLFVVIGARSLSDVWRGTMQLEANVVGRRILDLGICPACATRDIQSDATNAKLLRCQACEAVWHATKPISSGHESE